MKGFHFDVDKNILQTMNMRKKKNILQTMNMRKKKNLNRPITNSLGNRPITNSTVSRSRNNKSFNFNVDDTILRNMNLRNNKINIVSSNANSNPNSNPNQTQMNSSIKKKDFAFNVEKTVLNRMNLRNNKINIVSSNANQTANLVTSTQPSNNNPQSFGTEEPNNNPFATPTTSVSGLQETEEPNSNNPLATQTNNLTPGPNRPPTRPSTTQTNNWTPGPNRPPKQNRLEENTELKILRKKAGGGILSLKKGALQRYLRELERNTSNWKPRNYMATTHLRRMGVVIKNTNNQYSNRNENKNNQYSNRNE